MKLSPKPSGSTWFALRSVRIATGFSRGFTQGSVQAIAEIAANPARGNLRERLLDLLGPHFPASEVQSIRGLETAAQAHNLKSVAHHFETILWAVNALEEAAGIPAVRQANLDSEERIRSTGQDLVRMSFSIASLRPESAANALVLVTDLLNRIAVAPASDLKSVLEKQVDELLNKMRAGVPGWDNNTRHLIRAAFATGLPLSVLPTGVVQIGWGRKSRLFGSTASDATSRLGVQTAQHKLGTSALLRSANIPVPANLAARDAEAAVAAARRIGFPVVVKPVDKDRGEGVSAYLRSDDEVRAGFAKAFAESPNVMVEKYVEGAEHRLLVVNGELFWAFERVPAHVRGDGASTVRQLIEKTNAARRDGLRNGLSLRRIVIDDGLLAMLERQGLDLESVVGPDVFVRLRQVPLVNDGGNVIPVFDRIHPDNVALAERAVRLLRLDLAGVDFLIPDIARSWREVGGFITEINALPQFSPLSRPDIYAALLAKLVQGDGRIPAVLVIGDADAALIAEIRQALGAAELVAGIAARDRMAIGDEELVVADTSLVQQARVLASDPAVEAIVLFADCETVLREGLPLCRFDALAIVGSSADPDSLARLLRLATPHLKGPIIATREADLSRIVGTLIDGSGIETTTGLSDLVRRVCSFLVP